MVIIYLWISFVWITNISEGFIAKSTFRMIQGNKLMGQPSTTLHGKTSLACLTTCTFERCTNNCSAVNVYDNEYNRALDCDLINIHYISDFSDLSFTPDTETNVFIESSHFYLDLSVYSNVRSTSFAVRDYFSTTWTN